MVKNYFIGRAKFDNRTLVKNQYPVQQFGFEQPAFFNHANALHLAFNSHSTLLAAMPVSDVQKAKRALVKAAEKPDGTDGADGRHGRDRTDGRETDETDGTDRTGRTDGTDGADGRDGRTGRTDGTDGTNRRDGRHGRTSSCWWHIRKHHTR